MPSDKKCSRLTYAHILRFDRPKEFAVSCADVDCPASTKCLQLSSIDTTCQTVECGPAPLVEHTTLSTRDRSFDSAITYSCDSGYLPSGTTNTVCGSDGKWSLMDMQCNDINECVAANLCVGQNEVCNNIAGSYNCICDIGYERGASGTCVDIDECSRDTNDCSMDANCANFVGGYSCACDAGYSGDGYDCTDCGDPVNIANADVNDGSKLIGSRRRYTCRVGYKQVGEAVVTCGVDAVWSTTNLQCEDCGEAPTILNGVAVPGLTTIDSVRTYTCNGGFEMKGPSTITCSDTATWTTIPTCQDINECLTDPCLQECINHEGGYQCECFRGWTSVTGDSSPDYSLTSVYGDSGLDCSANIDCLGVFQNGQTTSGVYPIYLQVPKTSIDVYCDMTTDGGGWLVFQRRMDGTENFQRNWTEYETGFGNPNGEFWIGNLFLHYLTSQATYELRIDLTAWDTETRFAYYSSFKVGNASTFYLLTATGFHGDAGDSFSYHSGVPFSTYDAELNKYACAAYHRGGWWYNRGLHIQYRDCVVSNLNGEYVVSESPSSAQNVLWRSWKSDYSLKVTEMKIRQRVEGLTTGQATENVLSTETTDSNVTAQQPPDTVA